MSPALRNDPAREVAAQAARTDADDLRETLHQVLREQLRLREEVRALTIERDRASQSAALLDAECRRLRGEIGAARRDAAWSLRHADRLEVIILAGPAACAAERMGLEEQRANDAIDHPVDSSVPALALHVGGAS